MTTWCQATPSPSHTFLRCMAVEKKTRVLVGVCDTACPKPHLSPYENKIGGYPDFLPDCTLPGAPQCAVCGCGLVLLVQVYCPLEGSPYHRLLHVYCCTQQQCWSNPESWLVLRSQAMDHTSHQQQQYHHHQQQQLSNGSKQGTNSGGESNFALEEWCPSASDWGDTDYNDILEDTVGTTQGSSHSVTLPIDHITSSLRDLTLPTAAAYHGPRYDSFYINVFEEQSLTHDSSDMDHAYELLQEYNRTSENGITGREQSTGSGGGEVYERATANHGDTTFLKFHKQLSKCPRQVIRYERRGAPLLINSTYHPPTAVCSHCGSPSVFELQLMPPLVYLLQQAVRRGSRAHSNTSSADTVTPSAVEFGTVLVYCCEQSCWTDCTSSSSGWRQEVVAIQHDTDTVQLIETITDYTLTKL